MVRTSSRPDGRRPDEARPVNFILDYVAYPEGSVLVEMGDTRVLCNVSLDDGVPAWLARRSTGWLTAEYAMLPRATRRRTPREIQGLRGRTHEIRRLIGRALRVAVDLDRMGERTLIVDCDVLQADGGTRTAAITGGYVALALALRRLGDQGILASDLLRQPVAAISVGIVGGQARLDLCYTEDRAADVDCNIVMTADKYLVEIQGTAEGAPFPRAALDRVLDLASDGIAYLIRRQREALA
jgi:ribonuclease PH